MRGKEVDGSWLIRQVAEGDSALDGQKACKLASQLGICFDGAGAFCVAVKYMQQDTVFADASLVQALQSACEAAGKALGSPIYCYLGNHLYVVMVIMDSVLRETEQLKKLYGTIFKHAPAPVRMGVGRIYKDIDKLHYSRVEAYEALNSAVDTEKICDIDDIYAVRDMTAHKVGRDKRKIVDLFKQGELDQLQEDMTLLVEAVRAETPVRKDQPYPTSIRRTVVDLLFEIMHVSADAGVDVDRILNYQDPYSKIFEMNDTPDILAWTFSAIKTLACGVAEKRNNLNNTILAQAKKIIEDVLGNPELSLTMLSNELDLTPAYVSALFSREVGVGFQEYVTNLRIEKAKVLLEQSNMKINGIASQCGFRSASYFTVVFRKQTGISPGEYRNIKN